jgi:hypothetical protein
MLVMKGLRDYEPFVGIIVSSVVKNVIKACSQLVGQCWERIELRCRKKERMKEL